MTTGGRAYLRDLLVLFAAIAASLWFFVTPQLFNLSLGVAYSGDGLAHGYVVKTILDVGWYPVHTPFIGAPFGSDLFDYPGSDGLNFLLVRLLGLFSADWVVVSNLFYLLGFFLSGASAYVVLRKLGVASAWAIAGGVLFAFLPYHLLRRWHLWLASYAVVPLGIWLAYVAWGGRPAAPKSRMQRVGCALLVLATGSGGLYYAYFSAFLVAVAGAGRVLATKALREGVPALLIAAGITATVAVNVASTAVYQVLNGRNPEAAARPAADSETYGLRLTQLVFPHGMHRVGRMYALAERYGTQSLMVNENATASLGLVGTAGLVILALVALRRFASPAGGPSTTSFLALVAFACFLLGTMGGAGTVFAYLVIPSIRGYNRISVFIGFAALAAFLLVTQRGFARIRPLAPAWAAAAGAAMVAIVGVWEQTPREFPLGLDPLVCQRPCIRDDRRNAVAAGHAGVADAVPDFS